MAELVAKGSDPTHGWRRTLPHQPVTLGRSEPQSIWAAPWDDRISRLHVSLSWVDGKLLVQRLPEGRNRVFYRGVAANEFSMSPGEEFVIGDTTFALEDTKTDLPAPLTAVAFAAEQLDLVSCADYPERIEVLAALPGVIRYSPSNDELERRVVDVLLRGMPRAEAAAIVHLRAESPPDHPELDVNSPRVRQGSDNWRPSRRLVSDAIKHRRQSVLHIWRAGGLPTESAVTLDTNYDWALCVPLSDEPTPGWGLYVTGRLEGADSKNKKVLPQELLKSDLKFAELVAEIFNSLRQVLDLQRRQAVLARFLSRPVLAAIAGQNMEEVLRPRETEVTVIFCDLRGSCRLAEEGQADLMASWGRVSEALNVMAGSIIDQDGVIGDFQGDAAKGFWGWPLECPDRVQRAARAALAIRRRFEQASKQPANPLYSIRCGVGIATGRAIAGKLGTMDQFKIDLFGTAVNLAARLETMTKLLGVPVLIDERSAEELNPRTNEHWVRIRRVARVRPYGMQTPILISELLPASVEPGAMKEQERKDYEAALDAFQEGRWDDAVKLLRRLRGERGADFLSSYMERHAHKPPASWDGIIDMEAK
jgi:adenylate cyclase